MRETQSGERNMLHTLFKIFILFFPFSLLHSLSSSLLSLLHNLLAKQKKRQEKKEKRKRNHTREAQMGE